jgi:mono/diheme cytochrome c family protein
MLARHLFCALAVLAIGCGSGGGDSGDDAPLGGSLTVTGDVVDFQNGATVATGVSVTASGITPPPMITAQGSMFTITEVPENSVFQILAAATDYRPTFSEVIEVKADNVTGVKARVVKASYINGIATAFGITPTAAKGIVIVKLVDANGMPRANIPGAQLILAGSTMGPFFLDAQGNAAVGAQMSTASGYAVWFECLPGITEAGQAAAATITVDMATSPVAGGSVTLAIAKVTDGAPPALPTNVSFSGQILPIFTARGCLACHGASGPGSDLGGLDMNGGANKVHAELVTERPGIRVNLAMPEMSLILTKPLREEPPNHQTATFQNAQDPDYLKLLVWIREGAKNN